MDIKTRIDGLTEAEAKAALYRNIETETMFRQALNCISGRFWMSPMRMFCDQDELRNEILDEALKEARK